MKKVIFASILVSFLLLGACSNDGGTSTHEHDFETHVVDPTCEDKGYVDHICKECGYEYKDNYVDALGHDYSVYVVSEGTLEADEGKEIYVIFHVSIAKTKIAFLFLSAIFQILKVERFIILLTLITACFIIKVIN